ncbi:MAG: alpha/beta fold hydrolase [Candidatus Limnocylindrales bacterium]
MPIVRANGLDVQYEVEGAGPPLVLLHGATSTAAEDWSAQRPLFRKAFRLYLVDARGHGGTRWDVRDGFRRDLLVDDLLAFADVMGLSTFHVVGFSMGAMTALTFATRYPERLRTAMICGIDIVREPRSSVARRLMDPERIQREEPDWAAQLERRHGPVQTDGAWQRLLPAIATDVASAPLLTHEELRRIRLPVQLVYGDRDVFVPADHAVAIHRQLPDSRLFICPNSPHQVMVSQPALFNLAAGNFYRSTEKVARLRAEQGTAEEAEGEQGAGARAYDPQAAAAAAPVTADTDPADPFSTW